MTATSPPRVMYPPVWFALALATMIALDHWLPLAGVVPAGWRWLGLIVAVPGFGQGLWGIAHFVKAGTPLKPFTEATGFVRAGPYRYTRNPMYLGLLCVLIGSAIGLGSLSPWLIPPLFVWVITERFIRAEERMLEARFGEDFRRYRASVRRWL